MSDRIIEKNGSLTFDSHLCCKHDWAGPMGDKLPPSSSPEYCKKCAATCIRDENRKIIEYDANVKIEEIATGIAPGSHRVLHGYTAQRGTK